MTDEVRNAAFWRDLRDHAKRMDGPDGAFDLEILLEHARAQERLAIAQEISRFMLNGGPFPSCFSRPRKTMNPDEVIALVGAK